MFSTSEGYHDALGGNYDACGGYQEYIRGCWLDTMSTAGDIMSTSGDVQYIGRISWCMWGSKLIKSFKFLLKTPMYWTSPMYSWYPPMYWTSLYVLMISPRRTHGIPLMYWTSPDILMISPNVLNTPGVLMISPMYSWYPPMYWTPPCTHDIPPIYSWYPPMYWWCPPVFLNTPNVLNTHYTGWFWCRSCSKIGSLEGLLQLFLEREATKN